MIRHYKDSPIGGVLVDRGTNKRIPFAILFDTDTGYYEHYQPSPDGKNILVGDDNKLVVRKGKAVGKLELVPLENAYQFGYQAPPKPVKTPVILTPEQKQAGLQQYQEVYVRVWSEVRHEPRKLVDEKFIQFVRENSFLDKWVLKRMVPTH